MPASRPIISAIEAAIHELATSRGLLIASDESSRSDASMLGGMFQLDADTVDGLRAEQGWNDQPVIERLLMAALKSGQKAKAKPESRRLLVLLPDMRVVVVIALGFSGIADTLDVMKTGTWSLSFSVKGGTPCNGQGELVKNGEELYDMLGRLGMVFMGLQKDHGVPAPKPRSDMWDGVSIGGTAGVGEGFVGLGSPE